MNPLTLEFPPAAPPLPRPLPAERLERVWAWGLNISAMEYVFRPSTEAGIRDVLELARDHGVKVGLRGSGRSYGDASLNAEQICLDLTRMNRILEWNPESGVIRVEPGVTIQQLWRYVIEDGWWPYVVPGTMFPTIGGCASMNVHGKNNWRVGPIGDHILAFDLLLPTGDVRKCSRGENPELFHAAIGGFGMLGCFLSITLELKRIHSGVMDVTPIPVSSLGEMIRVFEERKDSSDYIVGWMDCFAHGKGLGRGLIHTANYLPRGADQQPAQSLRIVNQELPDTFLFGLMPKSRMWRWMRLLLNNPGMRFTNAARYHMSVWRPGHTHRQSHAEFAFLLDYVPDWKHAYLPGGLIQYQSFIPLERAEEAFRAQLTLCQKHGIVPYLGVFKRHRPDPFLMTHAVDGFSLALDFKVSAHGRTKLWNLTAELDQIVIESGGRFYFAKDSTLSHHRMESFLQEDRVQQFLKLKQECDPESLLQTDLYRRVFGV